MCIGFPMQVIASDEHGATVRAHDGERRIDMLLVGPQPPGTWVLEFHGAARRVLTAEEAAQTLDALAALDAALNDPSDSGAIDALFADLVDREPQLPEHLRPRDPARP